MIVERCKNCLKYKNKLCEGATFGGLTMFVCWDYEHEDINMIRIYHDLLKDVF